MIRKLWKGTVFAAAATLMGAVSPAMAEYPEKPVTMVIPLGAGGVA